MKISDSDVIAIIVEATVVVITVLGKKCEKAKKHKD